MRRRLAWRFEEDGSLSGHVPAAAAAGAVLLKALRAACADLAGDPPAGVSAETPAAADSPDAGAAGAPALGSGGRGPAGGPDVVGSG